MTQPHTRDAEPTIGHLLREYCDDPITDRTVLSVALRAALRTCAEEQAIAVDMLTGRPASSERWALLSEGLSLGRLEMCNRIIGTVQRTLAEMEQHAREAKEAGHEPRD